MTPSVQGPQWNNDSEYPGLDSKEFVADLESFKAQLSQVAEQARLLEPHVSRAASLSPADTDVLAAACRIRATADGAIVLGSNLNTFVTCLLSVDGGHAQGRQMQGILRSFMTGLGESLTALELILTQSPKAFAEACLGQPEFLPHRFRVHRSREWAPFMLDLDAEKLLTRFSLNGHHAWGTLYTQLSSSIPCEVTREGHTETMGLARAAGGLFSSSREERSACYRAINAAWGNHKESCAAILNALAGWRLDECRSRSVTKKLEFLDNPLHTYAIQRRTLATMMEVVESNLEVGREALRLKAKDLVLDALAPWDLFAPAPSSQEEGIPFAEAISLIRTAFGDVDPGMAEFVDTMATQGWIEGSVNDTKRPGAYCTRFAKSRTPRVYMTYRGSLEDIGTLAHELGHGFHSWVMRDLPLPETAYPMTLAETASIFAETVTSEVLLVQASKDPTQAAIKRQILWGELGSAEAFLLNIPARFWFESELYTRRQERPLSPDEISELMTQAWRKAYGSTLSEMNPLFWCSKLHFHMSSTSFYNFPYTFGYLFALGVYAQRPKHGAAFLKNYVGLLRDTGRMTVEDLARKHLGVDIQKPEFWQDSINLVRDKINLYRVG